MSPQCAFTVRRHNAQRQPHGRDRRRGMFVFLAYLYAEKAINPKTNPGTVIGANAKISGYGLIVFC